MNVRDKQYFSHRFKPEDLITFIELRQFTQLWKHFELTHEDFLLVQLAIMCDPQGPPVVKGSNGLRKVRFVRQRSDKGKSGGMRCLYRYFDDHKRVVLAAVYPKGVQDDLTDDQLSRIKNAIAAIEDEWNR